MKIIKNLTFAATAFLLSLLPQTATAQTGVQPQIEVTFEKWFTAFPQMEGIVGGDIVGSFLGEVLPPTPIAVGAGGHILQLEARYEIVDGDQSDGDQSFTAIVHGIFDTGMGKGIMNGVITEDWHKGSRVHVEFDEAVTDPQHPERGLIIVGTITILPN